MNQFWGIVLIFCKNSHGQLLLMVLTTKQSDLLNPLYRCQIRYIQTRFLIRIGRFVISNRLEVKVLDRPLHFFVIFPQRDSGLTRTRAILSYFFIFKRKKRVCTFVFSSTPNLAEIARRSGSDIFKFELFINCIGIDSLVNAW